MRIVVMILIVIFSVLGCTTSDKTKVQNRNLASVPTLPSALNIWNYTDSTGAISQCIEQRDNLSIALDLKNKQQDLVCHSLLNFGWLNRCVYRIKDDMPDYECFRAKFSENFTSKFKDMIELTPKSVLDAIISTVTNQKHCLEGDLDTALNINHNNNDPIFTCYTFSPDVKSVERCVVNSTTKQSVCNNSNIENLVEVVDIEESQIAPVFLSLLPAVIEKIQGTQEAENILSKLITHSRRIPEHYDNFKTHLQQTTEEGVVQRRTIMKGHLPYNGPSIRLAELTEGEVGNHFYKLQSILNNGTCRLLDFYACHDQLYYTKTVCRDENRTFGANSFRCRGGGGRIKTQKVGDDGWTAFVMRNKIRIDKLGRHCFTRPTYFECKKHTSNMNILSRTVSNITSRNVFFFGENYSDPLSNVAFKLESPLHTAVRSNDFTLTRQLVEAGADVNAIDFMDKTPLHHLAIDNHKKNIVELANFLIDNGADINAKDVSGHTPLDIAIKNKRKHLIDFFER